MKLPLVCFNQDHNSCYWVIAPHLTKLIEIFMMKDKLCQELVIVSEASVS